MHQIAHKNHKMFQDQKSGPRPSGDKQQYTISTNWMAAMTSFHT